MIMTKTTFKGLALAVLWMATTNNVDGKNNLSRKLSKKGGGDSCRFDILGSYGFSAMGFILPPPAPGTILNAVSAGIMTFYEHGMCGFVITANGEAPGGFTPPTTAAECTYELDQETGLGTLLVTDDALNPFTGTIPLSFVVVKGGEELRWIRTDAVGIAEGVSVRQCD